MIWLMPQNVRLTVEISLKEETERSDGGSWPGEVAVGVVRPGHVLERF